MPVPTLNLLSNCALCPRECGVNRVDGELGFCGAGELPKVARIALHHWEEPSISGTKGSGTVFFSGCNLKCCFCQNYVLSHESFGKEIGADQLATKFILLQQQGAHNINLVTGSHFAPQIAAAIQNAKKLGLTIPIVYNSSAYEKTSTLHLLEGLVDIYLPDLKYNSATMSNRYSHAPDYFEIASSAIMEMIRQCGEVKLDQNGIMISGVMVRHLVMPGGTDDSIQCLEWLKHNLPPGIYISLMAQYLPLPEIKLPAELAHPLTATEYEKVCAKLFELELEDGYVQELEAATVEFVPAFDLTGVDD